MDVPLLVTRAEADLDRYGPGAIAAPCIRFEEHASEIPPFDRADLLVASPRSAGPLARVPLPPAWRVLALAPATAAALRAAGVRLDVEVAGGGAELAREARPGPLVCATSDLGGDEVRRVRPDAVLWVLYRTSCPEALPAAALAALEGSFDVLFASPSAVRNFELLAPGALARARRVLCHGGTTVQAVEAAGFVASVYRPMGDDTKRR